MVSILPQSCSALAGRAVDGSITATARTAATYAVVGLGPAAATGTFPNSTAEQAVTFPAKSGRYVRLRALSEVNDYSWRQWPS